jgi:hypothetical protein
MSGAILPLPPYAFMTCTGTMFRLYVILPAAQIQALDGRTFTEQLIEFCRNLLRMPEDKYEKSVGTAGLRN